MAYLYGVSQPSIHAFLGAGQPSVEPATSLTPELQSVPQRYTGVLQLGIETDTHDTCGRVTATMPWSHVT
eukprot:1156722-Pelagomonas_calceolata.AAC.15